MLGKPYILTNEDKDLLNALILDLATEIDLHYDSTDLPALYQSFSIIKDAVALLQRADCQPHPDILAIVTKYDRSKQ